MAFGYCTGQPLRLLEGFIAFQENMIVRYMNVDVKLQILWNLPLFTYFLQGYTLHTTNEFDSPRSVWCFKPLSDRARPDFALYTYEYFFLKSLPQYNEWFRKNS